LILPFAFRKNLQNNWISALKRRPDNYRVAFCFRALILGGVNAQANPAHLRCAGFLFSRLSSSKLGFGVKIKIPALSRRDLLVARAVVNNSLMVNVLKPINPYLAWFVDLT
jgi:hypothetical protein